MKTSACAQTVIAGLLLAAGCGTDSMSAGDIAGTWVLVRTGSSTPPFTMTYEKIGVPGVMCVDTTFAHLLHVRADGTSTHEMVKTAYCPGDAPADRGLSLPGTWRLHGDSFHVRWTGPSLDGPVSAEFGASFEGDEIVFRNPTDGASTGAGLHEQVYRRVR